MSQESTSSTAGATHGSPPQKRKPRFLRLNAIVALPLLILPAWLGYFLFVDGVARDQVLSLAVSVAGEGGQAEVKNVTFSIFGPKLRIEGLRAYQHFEGVPDHDVLVVGDATFDVDFWPLLERRLVVNELTASKVMFSSPRPAPVKEGSGGSGGGTGPSEKPGEPPKTPNEYVNEYLKKIDDFLKSDEYKQGAEYLEKLRKYMEERDKSSAARKADDRPETWGRADYVAAALRARDAQPSLVIKKAGVSELEFVLAESGTTKFGSKLSNVLLEAQSISSDPVAYKLPMEFKAGGDLDGDKSRRVELGLVVRFDPNELIKLEQVKGAFTVAKFPLDGLVDTKEFGDTLSSAELSLVHYASEFPGMGGRTRLLIAGSINPPNFSLPGKPSRLSVSLWFGGFKGDDVSSAVLPSGIGLSVENVALEGLLAKSGGFPIPLQRGATLSFGTCDAKGRIDTPDSAATWNNGFKLFVRLKLDGLRFDEAGAKGKDSLGLPADLLAKGLNRVLDGLSKDGKQFELVCGFSGKPGDFKFGITRPGLRTFVDACINALYLNGDDLKTLVKLPFNISKDGKIGLASVDKHGVKRAPVFDVEAASDEGLGDLRVTLSLVGLNIAPKPGEDKIAGLPAEDFCEAFNRFIDNQGEKGANFRCRLFNDKGAFSPALESPGLRGLVDALVGVFAYTGNKLNTKHKLPFTVGDDFKADFQSVNKDGSVRNLNSPGADSDSLADLRITLNAANARISPKPGEDKILGLPARDFCDAFNKFANNQGGSLLFMLRAFDEKGAFSPALERPGTRGIVDAIISSFTYTGKELNERFNLPFVLDESVTASLESVNQDGSVRNMSSAGDSGSLADLRVALNIPAAQITPKQGQTSIFGLPAGEFCAGFNQFMIQRKGVPLRLTMRVFDAAGKFSPALESPGLRGIMDMIINSVTLSGKQLNASFNLPFKIIDEASVRMVSVDASGQPRSERSAGADAADLKGLRVVVFINLMYAVPKKGQDKVMGIPAEYFTFAWNAFVAGFPPSGFPLTFTVFDKNGRFDMTLDMPTSENLFRMLSTAVGVAAFEKNFGQVDGKYKNAFEAHKKGDTSKSGDIAKAILGGKDIAGGELPKTPKFPWQK